MTNLKATESKEAFMIKTEAIDFFGVLGEENAGNPAITGRICFRDGTRKYFYSSDGGRDKLKKRMLFVYESIARFFCHNESHQKFHSIIGYG